MARRLPPRDTALVMGAVALALSFAPSLVARRRRDQAQISVVAVLLGGAAGTATEVAIVRLAERLEGGEPAARVLIVLGGVASAALRLPAHAEPPVALAGTGALVAGVSALAGAVAPIRERPSLRSRWTLWAALAAGAAFAGGSKLAQDRKRRGRRRVTEWPGPMLATVSGGETSLVPRSTLDFEGSRFLGTALPAQEITAIRGDGAGARDPVRVFVGVRSADGVQERCRLAVDELERLGAFDRSRVLVASATLRGYVNPVPLQAEELYARGDVASVCVQFFDRRTAFMPLKVPVAARTHRELLAQLSARVPGSCEIAVYGESLGAWASQNVFRREGVRALDALRVGRALWAGTPFFSWLPRLIARGKVPTDDRVAFVSTRELLEGDPVDARRARFFFLSRGLDPVVVFNGLELVWRRPDWLPPDRRWIPGITFLQVVVDLLRATRWTSAIPQAAAHDYRVELPLAVNIAFGHDLPSEEATRLADRLIELEIERGELVKQARKGLLESTAQATRGGAAR